MTARDQGQLLDGYLHGSLSEQELTRLKDLLLANPEAVSQLAHLSLVECTLIQLGREEDLIADERLAGILAIETHHPPSPQDQCKVDIAQIRQRAERQLEAFLEEERNRRLTQDRQQVGWGFSGALGGIVGALGLAYRTAARLAKVAAVCSLVVIVVLAICLHVRANRPVAVLVDSRDARWDSPIENGTELRRGRHRLEQGYARVLFKSGAEIVLQAPSTIDLAGANRAFLSSGWITAKVPPAAVGFMVQTPASSVVDFGTEFGLLAGSENTSEVHVFAGRVGLTSDRNVTASARYEQLKEGQAGIIDSQGQIERALLSDRPKLFVRDMPTGGGFGIAGRRLSLADIVGGGNGLDTGVLGRGIDSGTGQITTGRSRTKKPDKGFVAMPSLPFIDGVFVPDSNDGSAIVTSTGISFKECPKTCGKNYEPIIDGAIFEAGSLGAQPGLLGGKTYDSQANPSIAMHPNAGITFDLNAIRSAMPEVEIERFRAVCGVSENVVRFAARDSDPNVIKVGFWVLVDGQVRFSKDLKAVPAQSEQIDIPLRPGDRFLTLATTHPGEYQYCWSLFAEPALELTTTKPAAAYKKP
jgi:hypothetical protein